MNVEFRPQPLVAVLHVLEYFHRVRRRRGDEVVVLAKSRDGAVIHEDAVLAQHAAVTSLTDRKRLHAVHVDFIQERAGIGALNIDFSERGDIANADSTSDRIDFARDRLQRIVFARPRKITWTKPQAGFRELSALLFRPSVRRRQTRRLEILAAVMSCEGAQRNGRIGRPSQRHSGFRNRLPCQFGHDRKSVDVCSLALVGCHAKGRISLQMLDGAEALALGQLDV